MCRFGAVSCLLATRPNEKSRFNVLSVVPPYGAVTETVNLQATVWSFPACSLCLFALMLLFTPVLIGSALSAPNQTEKISS